VGSLDASNLVFGKSEHRKKIEVLFAHLKRILRLRRLRLRGPWGAHDQFLMAAAAQNLRRMAMWLAPKGAQMQNPVPA
jgi:hypothetical protein